MTAASRLPNPTAKKKKLVCRIASQPTKGGGRDRGREGRKILFSPLSSYPAASISMTVVRSFAYIYHFVHFRWLDRCWWDLFELTGQLNRQGYVLYEKGHDTYVLKKKPTVPSFSANMPDPKDPKSTETSRYRIERRAPLP